MESSSIGLNHSSLKYLYGVIEITLSLSSSCHQRHNKLSPKCQVHNWISNIESIITRKIKFKKSRKTLGDKNSYARIHNMYPWISFVLISVKLQLTWIAEMSVLNHCGEDAAECPLCMEHLEVDDLNFFPCTCGYQVNGINNNPRIVYSCTSFPF